MEAIREQQERLARLHFEVGAEQVLYTLTHSYTLFLFLSSIPLISLSVPVLYTLSPLNVYYIKRAIVP